MHRGWMAGSLILLATLTTYADWPSSKTYQADTGDPKRVSDADSPFLGWRIAESAGTVAQTVPGMVGGLAAEWDSITDGKLKYSTSGSSWSFVSGQGVTTAIKWRIYIDSSKITSSAMPALQIGNGTTRYRLDFSRNVTGETGCILPGWNGSEDTVTSEGGLRVPNSATARYLPMSMDEWHTIRFQVGPIDAQDPNAGTRFDAWLDEEEGASDHHHIGGTTGKASGSTYIQWGVISTKSGLTAFGTNFIAWGQNVPDEADEIPPLPIVDVEVCNNGLDDDGDGLTDCNEAGDENPGPDPGCECGVAPPACGETTDIFERFNVNFIKDDPEDEDNLAGVPPKWVRTGYGPPASSDEDPSSMPGASIMDIAPFSPNTGPHYWPEPGPYAEERDEMYDTCMAVGAGTRCEAGDQDCCERWSGAAYHPTQPLRLRLILDKIPGLPEEGGCGSTEPECMAGVISLERETTADDLAYLPIDWTHPVTITAQVAGLDLINGNGLEGKWETFVTFDGYATTQETHIEWGVDGDAPNASGTGDYRTISVQLAPNQASPTGPTKLVLGVDFDYIGMTLPTMGMSAAFFENLSIVYRADVTKPLLHLDKMALKRRGLEGQSPSNDTFTIRNASVGTMHYTVYDDPAASWVSTLGGDGVSTGEADEITVSYDTAAMVPGVYTAVITVDSPENTKSAATIAVTLTVAGPEIELSETAFTHTIMQGQPLANDAFTVRNSGGGVFNYTITDGDVAWLTEEPSSGSATAGEEDQISVTYSTGIMSPGLHSATISVEADEADNSPQTIQVTIEVILTPPDYDSDGDVDQADFGIWQTCLTGTAGTPTAGLCASYADLNGDEHVDQQDFTIFEDCAHGPEVPFDPGCVAE